MKCSISIKFPGGDEDARLPYFTKEVGRVGCAFDGVDCDVTRNPGLDNVHVGEIREFLLQLGGEVREGGYGVRHLHVYSLLVSYGKNGYLGRHVGLTLKWTPWTKPDAHPPLAYSPRNGLYDLQDHLTPIFDTAPVFVRALVGHVLDELVEQVAVPGMDLDAIETDLEDRVAGSGGVVVDVLLDFGGCHFTGDESGTITETDSGGCDVRVATGFGEVVRVCGTAKRP
jgi:hypothetical protein